MSGYYKIQQALITLDFVEKGLVGWILLQKKCEYLKKLLFYYSRDGCYLLATLYLKASFMLFQIASPCIIFLAWTWKNFDQPNCAVCKFLLWEQLLNIYATSRSLALAVICQKKRTKKLAFFPCGKNLRTLVCLC